MYLTEQNRIAKLIFWKRDDRKIKNKAQEELFFYQTMKKDNDIICVNMSNLWVYRQCWKHTTVSRNKINHDIINVKNAICGKIKSK